MQIGSSRFWSGLRSSGSPPSRRTSAESRDQHRHQCKQEINRARTHRILLRPFRRAKQALYNSGPLSGNGFVRFGPRVRPVSFLLSRVQGPVSARLLLRASDPRRISRKSVNIPFYTQPLQRPGNRIGRVLIVRAGDHIQSNRVISAPPMKSQYVGGS